MHPRHKRRVAASVDARLVQVEVEPVQLVLQLLLYALSNLFCARVFLEEKRELFQRAPVSFGEEEVLWSVSVAG